MTTWPNTLPLTPFAGDFRETLPDLPIRSEMETGPAKLRSRTTAGVTALTVSYLLSKSAVDVLDGFYKNDLLSGTGRFNYPHPRTGTTVSCRFKKPPEYRGNNGTHFRVTLELEVMP